MLARWPSSMPVCIANWSSIKNGHLSASLIFLADLWWVFWAIINNVDLFTPQQCKSINFTCGYSVSLSSFNRFFFCNRDWSSINRWSSLQILNNNLYFIDWLKPPAYHFYRTGKESLAWISCRDHCVFFSSINLT